MGVGISIVNRSVDSLLQVSGRDGKPLPPWIVYDKTSHTVRGQPAETDTGDWSVQVGKAKNAFTIRVRRQIDDDYEDGSGDSYEDPDDPLDTGEDLITPSIKADSVAVSFIP